LLLFLQTEFEEKVEFTFLNEIMDNSGQANFVCPPILQPKDGLRYYLHFVFCSDCAGRKTPQEALAEATQSGR
jgi:hypothetical protein